MAAAEKFKAPEQQQQPTVAGETPSAAVQPIHDSDEEEVKHCLLTYLLTLFSGVTVRMLVLRSKGREFDSWSGRVARYSQAVTTWMGDCLWTGKTSRCITNRQGQLSRGVATGGYIGIYTPPNQSTLIFLCGCFVSLTQDKFDIVQFIPPSPNQIPGYASATQPFIPPG